MTTGGRRRQGQADDELLTGPYRQSSEHQSADVRASRPPIIPPQTSPVDAGQKDPRSRFDSGTDADRMLTSLYCKHYASLVRLAAVLVPDVAAAEELVQDSFVAMHGAWPDLASTDGAWLYLCHAVIRRCDVVLGAGDVGDRPASRAATGTPGDVVSTLRSLPPRQREVLVLRFHADLSESQIASAMGISKNAVRSLAARAMSTLSAGFTQLGD
jgi:DNA-directed RNA polymerase specialized sigma24 family protein